MKNREAFIFSLIVLIIFSALLYFNTRNFKLSLYALFGGIVSSLLIEFKSKTKKKYKYRKKKKLIDND